MDNFFPEPPEPAPVDDPVEQVLPAWNGPPEDVLPGVVPVELVIGRSQTTVVRLSGIRAYPTGLDMRLDVRVRGPVRRRDLQAEVFDGPYAHDRDRDWQNGRLKWGFELAGGSRVTNVDFWGMEGGYQPAEPWHNHPEREPSRPVLRAGGGSAGDRSASREYWLWPLPPGGPLLIVCEWPDQGIAQTVQSLDAEPFRAAAARAQSLWADPDEEPG
jgi:hypothetical protein